MNLLKLTSWEVIEEKNANLCRKNDHQVGRTSDGYKKGQEIFRRASNYEDFDLAQVIDLLRQLHKTAPFLFLNGNTFALIGKELMDSTALSLITAEQNSIVGHHITGTAIIDLEELRHYLPQVREGLERNQRIVDALAQLDSGEITETDLLVEVGGNDCNTIQGGALQLSIFEARSVAAGKKPLAEFVENLKKRTTSGTPANDEPSK